MSILSGAIPFITPWEYTIAEVPILGELTLQFFGPLVVLGVYIGIRFGMYYAKMKDVDQVLVGDQIFWSLVFGFIISHWVSVIFYFPEQIVADPPKSLLVLFNILSGLSSVGGFLGAFIGMQWFLRRNNQPILVYADINIFSLLIGMVFGRMGCAVVHDHPGKIVDADHFWAVGPWKCRCPEGAAELYQTTCCASTGDIYRYDLGLMEFLFLVVLSLFIYFVFDWRKAKPGRLVGMISLGYGVVRFLLDFMRASKSSAGVGVTDLRYGGLTPAQYLALTFFAVGAWLLFVRRPQDRDLQWAKESERLAAQSEAEQAARDQAEAAEESPAEQTPAEQTPAEQTPAERGPKTSAAEPKEPPASAP